jgi:hypothetical protein
MKLLRNQYFIFITSLLLVVFLITPSIVKITHALNDHRHVECKAFGQLHIHEVELDCDFQDFNVLPQFHSTLVEVPKPLIIHIPNNITSQYTFLSKYQKLHFALRGPPSAS